MRYADDWCVFITRASKRYAAALRDEIRDFLKDTAGLELSAEKTSITHVGDGFNFLGFRLCRETGQRGVTVPKIKIGEKAKKYVRLRLSEALRYRPQQESIALRFKRASHLIRGWREYFRIAHDFSRHTGKLDNHAFWEAVKAISRKSDMTTAQSLKRHYRRGRLTCGDGNDLIKFSDVSMKLDYRGPKEYIPGGEIYLDDFEDQSTLSYRETKRRYGSYDLRWEVMVRDSLSCRMCGKVVDYSTARIDHIIPAQNFASLPNTAKFPDMTALWHQQQHEIESGDRDIGSFIDGIIAYIGQEIARVMNEGLKLNIEKHACPKCGSAMTLKKAGKKKFWGCVKYPDCKTTLPDDGGKPGTATTVTIDESVHCPQCGKAMRYVKHAKGEFFACVDYPQCKSSRKAKNGKPVESEAKPRVSEKYKCKNCGKGLVRRKGRQEGQFFWGCSDYPTCSTTYPDADGKPNFTTKDKKEKSNGAEKEA